MLVLAWQLSTLCKKEKTQIQMRCTAYGILSRMHSNTYKATIEQVIQGLQSNDQQIYITKNYAVAVEKYEGQITQQQAQSFYVESQDFNPATLFPLLDGINYHQISNDLTTTKDQDQITKFIKKLMNRIRLESNRERLKNNKKKEQNKI